MLNNDSDYFHDYADRQRRSVKATPAAKDTSYRNALRGREVVSSNDQNQKEETAKSKWYDCFRFFSCCKGKQQKPADHDYIALENSNRPGV